MTLHKPNPKVYAIILGAILMAAPACAESGRVELGMSQDEVVRLLGEPDSKAILDGKVLRQIDELTAPDLETYRVVYIYDKSNLQIWFEAGKVSGVTRNGVSIL